SLRVSITFDHPPPTGNYTLSLHDALPILELQRVVLLVGRTLAAAAVVLAVLTPVRDRIPLPASVAGRLLLLLGDALAAGTVFAGLLFLSGYRWHWRPAPEDRRATA